MTKQIESNSGATQHCVLSDADFHKELVAAIPHLRAFARSLCGRRDMADDLAQETMLKAWTARGRFRAGTSFRAWTFTILRHHYFSQLRRERFTASYDEVTAERVLNRPGDQEARLEAIDVLRALDCLPAAQREVLILMAIGSMSYEEIAEVCNVAIGTIKSRIARARAALSAILEHGVLPDARHHFVLEGEVLDAFMARFRAVAPAHQSRAA
ncbi:sigma-70 family RNA polymerase sigma factor [Novosphingobium sp.]|uniref:sigma-70 family RNA polymerase sigma factor n=1 Tax=Novosphingobium sp. TaxID=1874826 RepID=UPI00260BE32E|nr:sigma-70 family RNA polymerase sigma factor [Novosphingobium sp.]